MLNTAGLSDSGGTVITNGNYCPYSSTLLTWTPWSRTQEQETPRPASLPLRSAPSTCSDQQEPPVKPFHHPHLLSYSHVIEVAHQATQQKLKLMESKVLGASRSLQGGCLTLGWLLLWGKLGLWSHLQTCRAQFRIVTMASITISCF